VHTLLFYDPGHFHAALTLRSANPRVASDVHLYAHAGPDRERFLGLVDAFNSREKDPTEWRVHVHEADDPLERLIAERRGDVVVLAGADKPWLTSSEALPHLLEAMSGPPLAMDIMTERHEVIARLRRQIVSSPLLFRALIRDADRPAIEIASVHHLYKTVNGRPLERPWWYYDVDIQGDGMVDIQSHLVDQVQWMIAGDEPGDFERDVELLAARRWTTPVPLNLYRDSTGEQEFPHALSPYVRANVLELACNGEIEYRVNGVRVLQRAEWGQREPPGTGDRHPCTIRGTHCTLFVRHGPETDYVAELDIEPDLRAAIPDWQTAFPGLGIAPFGNGFRFAIPEALRTTHESHFAMVLENFLDYVDAGQWPEWLTRGIRLRYELLARSRELALQ
jgi:predicted dehydrogenase